MSSLPIVGMMSRSGLMGMVENVVLVDLRPQSVNGFFGGGSLNFSVRLRSLFVYC